MQARATLLRARCGLPRLARSTTAKMRNLTVVGGGTGEAAARALRICPNWSAGMGQGAGAHQRVVDDGVHEVSVQPKGDGAACLREADLLRAWG